jgi:CRISPR-associated protein Csd1
MLVPYRERTSGISPHFLWDKSAYVLGVGTSNRLEQEHAAFRAFQEDILQDTSDEGLLALLRFLAKWTPCQLEARNWPIEITNTNIVFALHSRGKLAREYIHERPAAQEAWNALRLSWSVETASICLVSGQRAPATRTHPKIKGVWNAQSSGASVVSFNEDSFESYGHKQGDNAPVSESAAFKYATVLNRFLAKESGHRVQLGDSSCVFWADASSAKASNQAEQLLGGLFGADLTIDEKEQAGAVGSMLEKIRLGRPLKEVAPALASGVRFYLLALAPNAGRVSIRFWIEDDFGVLMERYQRYLADMRIEPADSDPAAPMWKYLLETAVLHKRENVPPKLAGDWTQAILRGQRYPQTLLANVLMRIRADNVINVRRVAILRAILVRNLHRAKEAPVALDPNNTNRGYRLGRLFAIYEHIQNAAQGGKVNATVKDKFYGAASTRPRSVFPLLDKGSAHHLSKIGKQSPGRRVNLEKRLAGIVEQMSPGADPFPSTLPLADQALFALGYYHQREANYEQTTAAPKTDQADKEPVA